MIQIFPRDFPRRSRWLPWALLGRSWTSRLVESVAIGRADDDRNCLKGLAESSRHWAFGSQFGSLVSAYLFAGLSRIAARKSALHLPSH